MKIAIDIDGVLADIVTPLLKIINSENNTKHAYKHITEWNIGKALGIDHNYINSKFSQIIESGCIKPYPDAVNEVNYIMKNHSIEIVTSRDIKFYETTLNWLILNGFNKIREIFPKDDNSLGRNNILIEDKLDIALEFSNKGKKAVLYRHPWNEKHVDVNENKLIYAKNWKEIVGCLTALSYS